MENVSSFLRKEIADTREFLKDDIGKLNHIDDPMQIKSFTRGKQAAFCMAHDRVVILENAHNELIKASKKMIYEYECALKLIAEGLGMVYSENNFVITNKKLLNKLTSTPTEV